MSGAISTARRRALEGVRRIVLDAVGERDVRVYLFGSSVTGRVRQSSDIDVGIDGRDALPAGFLAELRERLEESDVPYDVDVVDLARAGEAMRARVEREGIRWTA